MPFPVKPPKSRDKLQSLFTEGYNAVPSLPSAHSVCSERDPMIFCQYCGWRESKSLPRCTHCLVITDSVLKSSNFSHPCNTRPNLNQLISESLEETLSVPPSSDTTEHGSSLSCPSSPESTCSQLQSQTQDSPVVSSDSVSVQPSEVCPESNLSRLDASSLHGHSSMCKPECSALTLKNDSSQASSSPEPSQPTDGYLQTPLPHPCRYCKLSFAAPYLLHSHLITRHKHACNMCRRTFREGLKLAQHQAYAHFVPRTCNPIRAHSNPCPARRTCGTLKTRKPYTKPSHVCQACSRTFCSPGMLLKHRCNPRHVQCTSCGSYFGSLFLFRNHKSQNKCSSSWKTTGVTVAPAVSLIKAASPQRDNPTSASRNSNSANLLRHRDSFFYDEDTQC